MTRIYEDLDDFVSMEEYFRIDLIKLQYITEKGHGVYFFDILPNYIIGWVLVCRENVSFFTAFNFIRKRILYFI